ncbi:MAG: hypothetical protein AVDCRST_MAG77-178, partial [uncultured Chloroflexi bacterium]
GRAALWQHPWPGPGRRGARGLAAPQAGQGVRLPAPGEVLAGSAAHHPWHPRAARTAAELVPGRLPAYHRRNLAGVGGAAGVPRVHRPDARGKPHLRHQPGPAASAHAGYVGLGWLFGDSWEELLSLLENATWAAAACVGPPRSGRTDHRL